MIVAVRTVVDARLLSRRTAEDLQNEGYKSADVSLNGL